MTVPNPIIEEAKLTDTENGLILSFVMRENLEPTNELGLWVRARIKDSKYYQPLDLSILADGITAEATIEPGKVQRNYIVDVQWYLEAYPEREKSIIASEHLDFVPDWFKLTAFEHELRSLFERMTVEAQAEEAARYRMATGDEANIFPSAALNTQTGLWMLQDIGAEVDDAYVGICPDQPDEGWMWRRAWMDHVLKRSREIRTEYGWDDDENH